MTRIDPINATIWIGGAVLVLAVWGLAAYGAWDIGSRVIPWLFQDAGTLTGCVDRGLIGGECSAYAMEGL